MIDKPFLNLAFVFLGAVQLVFSLSYIDNMLFKLLLSGLSIVIIIEYSGFYFVGLLKNS